MSFSVHRSAITQIQKWFLGSRKNKGGKDKKEDETTKSIAHQTVQAALQFGVLVRIGKNGQDGQKNLKGERLITSKQYLNSILGWGCPHGWNIIHDKCMGWYAVHFDYGKISAEI